MKFSKIQKNRRFCLAIYLLLFSLDTADGFLMSDVGLNRLPTSACNFFFSFFFF